ncbi:MAG: hypothetical protein ACLQU1_31395 [Bryobacteraceae bacterium]
MRKIWLLPLVALAMYGADISGKWTGSVEIADPSSGEKMSIPVKAEFTQKAAEVSGTIGREQDTEAQAIREGKLDGKNLVFEVQPPEGTSAIKFKLVVVSDDRIEGDMQGAVDAGNISGKVILTRVK